MKNRRVIPLIVYLVTLVLIFSWLSGMFSKSLTRIPYSDIVTLFQTEQVRKFVVDEDTIQMELYRPYNGETVITASLADPEEFRREMNDLFLEQKESGVLESYNFVPEDGFSPYSLILPLILAGLVLLLAWTMIMNRANAGGNPLQNFGKARTVLGVPDGKKVTFQDVAGADEEKEELHAIRK